MHPSSLLSYYPNYQILDEIVSYNNYKNLRIFIDLKNTLQTTYMQHAIVNIIEMSRKANRLDSSIFSSLLSFLSFHKIYGLKRGINLSFVIFFETGQSYYHKNISKKYKISRRIDDLYGLDVESRELFYNVLQSNFGLIEKACNQFPDTIVCRVPNLEADFIPYFLLTRNLVENNDSIANIIYSNDHDLWQCASRNTFIFSKSVKSKKIIKSGSIMSLFLKKECSIPDEFFPLAMSIVGDTGDDVEGIRNIGEGRLFNVFPDLIKDVTCMNEIYDKVQKNQKIFDIEPSETQNKYLNSILNEEAETKQVSKNLKLVSFELISRAVEDPDTTEMMDKRDAIIKTVKEKTIVPKEPMKSALERSGILFEEGAIDILYL